MIFQKSPSNSSKTAPTFSNGTKVDAMEFIFYLYILSKNNDFAGMKKHILLFVSALLTGIPFSQAQVFDKYAGEFLAGGVGARYLGMGNTAVSFTNDPFSVYWNPAGLTAIPYSEIAFMHQERFAGIVKMDFLSFVQPFNESTTIGLGILRNGVDDIPDTRAGWKNWDKVYNTPPTGYEPGFFNAAEYAVYASYASTQWFSFPVGLNVKGIYRSYGSVASAWGIGIDAGTQFNDVMDVSNLKAGLVARDLTSTLITWDNGTTELIAPSLESGLSWQTEALWGRFIFAGGMINRIENRRKTAQFNVGAISSDLKGGIEYSYNNKFAIRSGINELKRINFGAGFKIQSLWIDYAFESFNGQNDLGNSHRISVALALDKLSKPRD